MDIASTSEEKPLSHDEILIDYLIKNSFLWDKTNQSYRNRVLKDSKWKEIADKLSLTMSEAMRRYKTLCERYRREHIKQHSQPNYSPTWTLYDKFGKLKELQMSDFRHTKKFLVKKEEDATNGATEMDFVNDNNDTIYSDGYENFEHSDGRHSSLMIEPEVVGGSTDLSTDTIAAFCQFLEASLKRLPEEHSDELIEDISNMLFRKKREFKESNLS